LIWLVRLVLLVQVRLTKLAVQVHAERQELVELRVHVERQVLVELRVHVKLHANSTYIS
jgi:hypothetical protein